MHTKLTVYFDGQFWVGVVERYMDDGYSAAKTIFGNEPSDTEIFQFIRHGYSALSYSVPSQEAPAEIKHINPKRLQRLISKELSQTGAPTKAHDAIRSQIEMRKTERKEESKTRKEEKRERNFQLKQEKKKKKHRGH
jgi:hypothetical protein